MSIIDTKNLLVGEGPLWDERRNLLYTIDIRGKCIRITHLQTGQHTEIVYEQEIGCIALTTDGRILAAMTDGIYYAEANGTLTPVCIPGKLKGRRFNDGKVGPDGRFYVGTTDVNHQGAFYRLDVDGTFTELFDQVGCSNGLAWSRDGKTMYYCDSPRRVLEAFDFDKVSGELSNRRTIMSVPCDMGEFDGMTIDCEDNLWVAVWGASCALKIDPQGGKVLERIEFSTPCVSCCGFAGENLQTLIVTTAGCLADLTQDVEAGFTYALNVDVPGVPCWRYGE